MNAPFPGDEQERLQELLHLNVLDILDETEFSNLAMIASQICQTPIAFVSLVDQEQQRFKARIGFEIDQLPRHHSLCAYTILSEELSEILDMTQDVRFHDSPIVTTSPFVRYYAGAPLVTSAGYKLGALCVLDREPRQLTDVQKSILIGLAKEVVQRLELKASNQRLLTSLSVAEEISQVGMFEYDFLARQLTLTPTLSRLFNLAETVRSIPIAQVTQLISVEDFENIRKSVAHQLSYGTTFRFTYQFTDITTGKRMDHECQGAVAHNEQGQAYLLTGAVRDITQEKIRTSMVEEQEHQLKKVNLELDNLVYRVSHDLRAPLASALGLLYLSQQEKQVVAIQPLLKMVEETLHQQDRYISKILDYSHNSRGDIQHNDIDLAQLITEQIEIHRPNLSPVEVLMSINQSQSFYSDRQRLSIVISNIISNAFRFSRPARAQPFISIEALVTQQNAWFRISDNGIGIAQQHIGHIFKMFYRATDLNNGSGIGLYIVKETIEKLSGTITVRSLEGVGSTFEVSVPNMNE